MGGPADPFVLRTPTLPRAAAIPTMTSVAPRQADLADAADALSISSTSSAEVNEDVIRLAEDFVRRAFANHDPSHDYHHVDRVRLLALSLTLSPEIGLGPPIDVLVVELGALFHDLIDSKYSSSDLSSSSVLAPFFTSVTSIHPDALSPAQIATIEKIVSNVSWSKDERRRQQQRQQTVEDGPVLSQQTQADSELNHWLATCKEFWCVSDADRLDSIGSIGIMRCSAFSCVKSRPLYIPPHNAQMDPVPPAEQAQGYNGSAVAHFYEK